MGRDFPDDYADLAALGAEIHALFDRIARREAGLTLVQYRVLATLALAHPDPLEPLEVGRAIQAGSNHMAKVLDQLEAMGFIARRMHAADRRRRLLDLTPKGLAVVERAGPRIGDAQERLMGEAFTPGERRQLMRLTGRLRSVLAEIRTPVVPPRPGP